MSPDHSTAEQRGRALAWAFGAGGSALLIVMAWVWLGASPPGRTAPLEGPRHEVSSKSSVSFSNRSPAAANASGGYETEAHDLLPLVMPDQIGQIPPQMRVAYCVRRIRDLFAEAKRQEDLIWQTSPLPRKASRLLVQELSRDPFANDPDLRNEYRAFIASHPELREVLVDLDKLMWLNTTLRVADGEVALEFVQDGLVHGGLQEDFERLLARADAVSGYEAAQPAGIASTVEEWKTHLEQRVPLYDAAISALVAQHQIPARIVQAIATERETSTARFFVSYYQQSLLSGRLYETVQDLQRWREALRGQFPGTKLPPELSALLAETANSVLF
jgi:hypothetical protein